MKGNQITPNIVDRAEKIIKGYYDKKGFGNATIKITQAEDLSAPNENIVDINIDKHGKVKVHKIYITGNEVMSSSKLQRVMKNTTKKATATQKSWPTPLFLMAKTP